MRRGILYVALLGLAGCTREKTFDDRYNVAANAIEQRVAEIDHQLNAAETSTAPAHEQR